ncbi:MAG: hypothetical protein MPW15_13715 [Candidatus Manganitrophus sp.]|nr:hypothetical protein [Candidatus Manganitrophus sp.]
MFGDQQGVAVRAARARVGGGGAAFQTLNSMPAEIADLKVHLTLQMDQLPRQARWQAELMATDLAGRLVAQQLTSASQWVKTEREAGGRHRTAAADTPKRPPERESRRASKRAEPTELRAQPLALQIDVEKGGPPGGARGGGGVGGGDPGGGGRARRGGGRGNRDRKKRKEREARRGGGRAPPPPPGGGGGGGGGGS